MHAVGKQLEMRLDEKRIAIIYKYKSGTNEIQGISFSKEGIQMKGSQIDRSLSYGNIDKQLILNSQQETLADAFRRTANENRQINNIPEIYSAPQEQEATNHEARENTSQWLIQQLASGFTGADDTEDDAYKKKRRKNNNDNQMSR